MKMEFYEVLFCFLTISVVAVVAAVAIVIVSMQQNDITCLKIGFHISIQNEFAEEVCDDYPEREEFPKEYGDERRIRLVSKAI